MPRGLRLERRHVGVLTQESRREEPAERARLRRARLPVHLVELLVGELGPERAERRVQGARVDRVVVHHAADVEEDDLEHGPMLAGDARRGRD